VPSSATVQRQATHLVGDDDSDSKLVCQLLAALLKESVNASSVAAALDMYSWTQECCANRLGTVVLCCRSWLPTWMEAPCLQGRR
jgi:hypothetical protein